MAGDRCPNTSNQRGLNMARRDRSDELGRVGYLVLYLLGTPIGILLLLWVLLGDNLIGAG